MNSLDIQSIAFDKDGYLWAVDIRGDLYILKNNTEDFALTDRYEWHRLSFPIKHPNPDKICNPKGT